MALQRCAAAGRPGWRWGGWGHCYTYSPSTESAAKQKARLEGEVFFPLPLIQRVTDQGLVDPNATAKDAIEAKLLKWLAALFGIHLRELLRLLGTPPDRSKIPTNLWPRWEKELAQGVRPILDEAALTAGEQLILVQNFPVTLERAAEKARRWSSARSLTWAAGIIASTRPAVWERVSCYLAEEGRDLAEDLGFHFGRGRADTEAVTETTHAFTQGERLIVTESRTRAPLALEPGGYTIQTEAIWHTMRDERVCDRCSPLDGLPEGTWGILPEFPPLHYNCILPGQSVVAPGGVDAAAKSFYVGRAIEIRLADGRRLTITENHPILTLRGWVCAQFLRQADQVICATRPERIAAAIDPNDNYMPALIEQIWSALKEASPGASRSMPVSAKDFHGDGRNIDGNVNVIRANGFLHSIHEAEQPQGIMQKPFYMHSTNLADLLSFGALDALRQRYRAPTSSSMTSSNLMRSLSGRHASPFERFGFGSSARLNASGQQSLAESPAIDSHLARQFMLRFTSDIASQQIVEIRDFDVRSHVYDLQCDLYGLYLANGVVSKNCRCWVTYAGFGDVPPGRHHPERERAFVGQL